MQYSTALHRLLALTLPLTASLLAMPACAAPIHGGDGSDDATGDVSADSTTTTDTTTASATGVTTTSDTSTTTAEASTTSSESTSSESTSSESSGEQTDTTDTTDTSSTAAESTGEDPIGNCCEPQVGAGCDAAAVADCVCADDPYCCLVQWDLHCTVQVEQLGCGDCPPM